MKSKYSFDDTPSTFQYLVPRTCPVCKKTFYPAPRHAYRVTYKGKQNALVCTYTCMRAGQKLLEAGKSKEALA